MRAEKRWGNIKHPALDILGWREYGSSSNWEWCCRWRMAVSGWSCMSVRWNCTILQPDLEDELNRHGVASCRASGNEAYCQAFRVHRNSWHWCQGMMMVKNKNDHWLDSVWNFCSLWFGFLQCQPLSALCDCPLSGASSHIWDNSNPVAYFVPYH